MRDSVFGVFAAHPPFQLDGNLGFVGALAEMLVQSHAGIIELLPALPAELPSGSVRGLIARPGIAVDLDWEDGVIREAALTPRRAVAAGEYLVQLGDRMELVTLAFGQRTVLTDLDSPNTTSMPIKGKASLTS